MRFTERTEAGKGSRPRKVDMATYSDNHDFIFGKTKTNPVVVAVSDDDLDEPLDPTKACSLSDDECESCQ